MSRPNTLTVGGYTARIHYDPDIKLFVGDFIGLNGGAEFESATADGLIEEARISLEVFLETCRKAGIEPRKTYSGNFAVRLRDPALHGKIADAAAAQGVSLNQFVEEALRARVAGAG